MDSRGTPHPTDCSSGGGEKGHCSSAAPTLCWSLWPRTGPNCRPNSDMQVLGGSPQHTGSRDRPHETGILLGQGTSMLKTETSWEDLAVYWSVIPQN